MTSKEEMFSENSAASPRLKFNLRKLSIALVIAGLFVSGYLSYVKLTEVKMVCVESGIFNCEVVQNSVYSRLFGIPIAWLGFAVYLTFAAILALESRVAFLREYGLLLFFGINLFAWMFSMWLVYVQFVLLQALCPWCLTHETIITILFVVTLIRLKRLLSTGVRD